jgi:hypothetical protein
MQKNDEFYTQYHDIEKEINAYLEFNPLRLVLSFDQENASLSFKSRLTTGNESASAIN